MIAGSSTARHHAEWLSLLEISGPFLSMPVLMRAFPQGLDKLDSEPKRDLQEVYEEWLDDQGGLRPDPAIHRAWVEWVLRYVLEMPDDVLLDTHAGGADRFSLAVAEHGETLRPDFVILQPDSPVSATPGEGREEAKARLLIQLVPPKQDLEKPLARSRWKASPATRMMTLLHATGIRLGLLTNGEQWMLVDAPPADTAGFISWYAQLWLEEPLTLRAFRSLLGVHRFFNVPDEETIEALLADSSDEQQEVTDQLGYQVRAAVELLVQAIDLADQDLGGALLSGVSEAKLYVAALKVMMRLVFLLSAEERELLPLDDPFYNEHYAVSTLRAQLQKVADQTGEEILERHHDAWCRLLATFRAVHGGIQHDRLTLPAYGGGLFDPDELSFLEGRSGGTAWRETPAFPLPINNRTVLHLLDALQMLQVRVPGGGGSQGSLAEARRLSFRALDIEQIGHVYEGLLDHTAKRASAPVLGLKGTRHQEPEIPLPDLESRRAEGENALIEFLKEQTGRTPSALHNDLTAESDTVVAQMLRAACGNDPALYARVLPFAGLVREDSYGHPVIIPVGSVYVTAGVERRATGTHYTPRSLTEPIVRHTLEPLIYRGPADGLPREEWELRSAAELLDLKICDMAMGSGAFLVQTCRYLSERLVEAWESAENRHARAWKKKWITVEGKSTANPDEALPSDTAERLALARRLLADRCLYGVDKNSLAVEMAKLSLWLITLDKGRPFTFLDHALKCGDSIIGVNLDQLICWNLEGEGERHFDTEGIRLDIEEMVALRREIAETQVRDTRDQAYKAHLLTKAEAIVHDLRQGADMLVGSHYNTLTKTQQQTLRDALLRAFTDGADVPPDMAAAADLGDPVADHTGGTLRPFHWPLEFPEVFLDGRGGFDAFVGNPPFIGGRRIRATLGDRYREILYDLYPDSSGNADYCAFFFLRGFSHLRSCGTLGLIATNTIAQGDTRQTGLQRIAELGATIYSAENDRNWPGQAAVTVSVVHISNGKIKPPFSLDGKTVRHISNMLDSRRAAGEPYSLAANEGVSFQGSVVVGMGFVLEPDAAEALMVKNLANKTVIFPYLNGEDFNTSPEQFPSRWVINFFDWPLQRGAPGSWFNATAKQQKEWKRSGTVPDDYPGPVAADYPDCLDIVREQVYPVRAEVRRRAHRVYWWHYGDKRPALYDAIAQLEQVLVTARVSKYVNFSFVPNGWVYNEKTFVFPFETYDKFALLQSNVHEAWAWNRSSTMRDAGINYAPRDCILTFPFFDAAPSGVRTVEQVGKAYHEHRRCIMQAHQAGLTDTYNRFHNPEETADDIARLRELHVEMDYAVAAAYGWDDLDLQHDLHETRQGQRFTISQEARWEVLDRLLALNHERYEEEVQQGLHERKGRSTPYGKAKKTPKTLKENPAQMRLFHEEE